MNILTTEASLAAVPFTLFGAPHAVTLLLIGAFAVATCRAGAMISQSGNVRPVALALAVILVSMEIFKMWLAVSVYGQPWSESLPLHLCRLSMLLCAAMLALQCYRIFEVVYFWVMGGSIAALLTPDLAHGFPHMLYFTFFAGHALAVFGVLYAVSAYGFRPRLHSITLTAAVSAVYILLMIAVNWLLGANYLYLREKPQGASLYDYLGPWPWYVLSAWAVGILVCVICYAPFALRRKVR